MAASMGCKKRNSGDSGVLSESSRVESRNKADAELALFSFDGNIKHLDNRPNFDDAFDRLCKLNVTRSHRCFCVYL